MSAPARWAAVFVVLGVPVGASADGAALYKAHCALCHGDVPAPKFVGRSVDDVKKTIAEGKGRMRPVALSPPDADAIARFVAAPEAAGAGDGARDVRRSPGAMEKIATGDRLAAARDDKRALDAYLDAINLDPVSVEARLKLAGQYQRMGHPAEAARQWELALALEPGNAEATKQLREAAAKGQR